MDPKEIEKEGFGANLQYGYLYRALRRACKHGIRMATVRDDQPLIHFILDDIDMQKVCDRKNPFKVDVAGKGQTEPITSSELRFVYRNWNDLQKNVHFYVNLELMAPPWIADWAKVDVTGKVLISKIAWWEAYAQHRLTKHSGTLPKKDMMS